jgi:hypothetical protein
MTRFVRVMLTVLLAVVALAGAAPAAAQGVGFGDMPGLQEAVTRTWKADQNLTPADVPSGDARGLRKPVAYLMLSAVYSFDTEANATAAYQLLQTDMNATGMSGQPLTLTPIALPITVEHTAAAAVDDTGATHFDFTLVLAQDGTHVYTVIGITSGGTPRAGVAATVRAMVAGQVGAEPATLDIGGGSTGGLWGKVPSREAIERSFRGIVSVEDAAPFPA